MLVIQSCLTVCNPMDYSLQAFLFMGFPRQKYCSGLPFSTPGDLPDPGIKSASLYVSCTSRWILDHCITWEAPWSYNKFNINKNLSIYHNLFIHFSINGYFGCSSIWFLQIVYYKHSSSIFIHTYKHTHILTHFSWVYAQE